MDNFSRPPEQGPIRTLTARADFGSRGPLICTDLLGECKKSPLFPGSYKVKEWPQQIPHFLPPDQAVHLGHQGHQVTEQEALWLTFISAQFSASLSAKVRYGS